MRIEWWYDDASFHYSAGAELDLARLTVRDDGTAQILTSGGEIIELENETEASIWFLDEEFRRLEDLLDDLREEGRPVNPRIKPPTAPSDKELLPQMTITLDAERDVPSTTRSDSTPKQS
jgi:hypothetical protein